METETLLDKVDRSSDEVQKLIAQIIETPPTEEERELIAQILDLLGLIKEPVLKELRQIQKNRELTPADKKKLIYKMLDNSKIFKNSNTRTTAVAVPDNTDLTLIKALFEVKKELKKAKALRQLSQWIIDVIPKDNSNIPVSIERINNFPLEALQEILNALKSKEILHELAIHDPLTVYSIKGVRAKWDLLFDEEMPLDSGEVASLLGVTRRTVSKWRAQGKFVGIYFNQLGYLYPAWQFQNNRVIEGLDRVLKELQEYHSWTRLSFLKTGDIRLNGATPLEKLRSGDIDAVVWAASCYGKQISA